MPLSRPDLFVRWHQWQIDEGLAVLLLCYRRHTETICFAVQRNPGNNHWLGACINELTTLSIRTNVSMPEMKSDQYVSDRSLCLLEQTATFVSVMQSKAALLDRESQFPTSEVAQLSSCGALASILPVSHGGLGMGTEARGALYLFDLLRIIGRGNLAVGRVFEGHVNALVLVAKYGNDEQLQRTAHDALSGHLFAVWNTQPPEGLQVIGG